MKETEALSNKTKGKLREGKAVIGSVAVVDNLFVIEAMSRAGFDFIVIDTQHTPLGVEGLYRIINGLSASGTDTIVRVLANDTGLINRVLDYGADGIIIPLTNTAEEVARAVSAARYPPDGIRSWGARKTEKYGGPDAYAARANQEMLVLPQVETAQAVENIDEILQVKGVDGIMVGPADLAMSMGHPPRMSGIDEADKAILHVLDRCKVHGVPFGMFTGSIENAEIWVRRGAQIATAGADLGFVAEGAARTVRRIKEILSKTA